MLRVIFVVIIFVGIFVGCSPADNRPPRAADHMLIGVSPDYPPFESVDIVRDTIIGFDIELISIICEINQWSFEIIPTPFDNLLTELQSGGLDIAISAMTITPEREVLISFSEPYYLTGQALVLIVGDSTVAELEDLRGKRVGVVSGTTGAELARETDGALVFPYDNIKTALSELSEGNLEVVINDQGVSRALLKDYPNLWVATNMLNSEYYGMAMRSDDSVRLEKLDYALAGILGGYTYERLHDRWFDYPLLDLAVPDSIQALWPSE